MMKNKSTLAKLLSEEDINVVHKQMDTAYFDSKKRELGLPIWKDEDMTKDIYDLMVCHEIGHALWTPLDMLEKAALRKINHSFVNIIEDARIERFVKNKYAGSINVFNRGYTELVAKDFFGTKGKDINSFNLIDRINLFFKGNSEVKFSDEETVWVEKVSTVKTEDEVLDLAEALYKWMEENESETDNHDNGEGEGTPEPNNEEGNGNGESGDDTVETDGNGAGSDTDDGTSTDDGNSPVEENGDDGNNDTKSSGDDTDNGDDSKDGSGSDKSEKVEETTDSGDGETKNSGVVGGVDSDGKGGVPVATTDSAFGKALDAIRDKLAADRIYGKIPKIDIDKYVVGYKTVIDEFYNDYVTKNSTDNGLYFSSCLTDVETLKDESKKTVAYMVKEFEMKKAADQYARAAESKTGSLDMSKLHTYKYNEDLFLKVTTLPGATNHGMVMVLDWSGSMHDNLKGTLAQLFNLVWFCRKVKIPFEVFAFSDAYGRRNRWDDEGEKFPNFKCGEIAMHDFKLLNFFSSNMTLSEETNMMHALMMFANRYGGYRDWNKLGYPLPNNENYSMGGTPLNDAIIAMMDIVPKFKEETGVQKVHTIFLTDGASNSLHGVYDYHLITEDNERSGSKKGDHIKTINGVRYSKAKFVVTDPVTNKTFMFSGNTTEELLKVLKNRVDGMNVIGFFIAGSGKSGRVDKRTIQYLIDEYDMTKVMELVKKINKEKYLALTQCGYDEYYVLPGGNALAVENDGLGDELVGASKAKLKTAFGKSMKGKIESRQLLNKFVKLVA